MSALARLTDVEVIARLQAVGAELAALRCEISRRMPPLALSAPGSAS